MPLDFIAIRQLPPVKMYANTACSHRRIMILEVMGRNSGDLARTAALAAGAEIVVTPERGPLHTAKMDGIANRLEKTMHSGQDHGIVIVAEGVEVAGKTNESAASALHKHLEKHFCGRQGLQSAPEIRVNVLGHLQRGGPPTATDRILAVRFAKAVYRAICGESSRSGVIGLRRGRIVLHPFQNDRLFSLPADRFRLYETFKAISKRG